MRYLVAILSFCVLAKLALAQDATILNIDGGEVPAGSIQDVVLPTCDDSRLSALLQQKITELQGKTPATNISDKRQQILITKNLANFTEVPVAGFKPETNFDVANKIIMSKINDGLSEKQMRICSSDNLQLEKIVYLFIYPSAQGIKVDIINLFNRGSASNNFSFIY